MKRYFSFFLLALALGIAPGPDVLFVLAQALAHGWQAGACVTLGLCTGLCFHVSLAAFGFAAFLKRYPWLFKVVTWFGAAYLVWLGVSAWRAAGVVSLGAAPELPPHSLYLRGIVMNALNPKVMLFFLALLPRFVAPEKGKVLAQFLLLGLLFAVATLLVFNGVALLGGFLSSLVSAHLSSTRTLEYFSAIVMFGLAGWIAWRNLRDK